jgi:hypothetical protein
MNVYRITFKFSGGLLATYDVGAIKPSEATEIAENLFLKDYEGHDVGHHFVSTKKIADDIHIDSDLLTEE